MSTDLWLDEGIDVEADATRQRYVAARAATAPIFQFIASATSPADYDARKELQSDRITSECSRLADGADVAVLASQVMAAMDSDYELIQRMAAMEAEAASGATFTRQHYNGIANALHSYQQKVGRVPGLTEHFTNSLSSHQGFNPERFTNAVNQGNTDTFRPATGSATMSRKHFQGLADIIKAHPSAVHRQALAEHFAGALGGTNPQFNRNKFIEAATGSGVKEASKTASSERQPLTHLTYTGIHAGVPLCGDKREGDAGMHAAYAPEWALHEPKHRTGGPDMCPGCQKIWQGDTPAEPGGEQQKMFGSKTATAPGRSPKQKLYRHLMDDHGLERAPGTGTGYVPVDTPHATLSIMHDREHAAGNDHPGIDTVGAKWPAKTAATAWSPASGMGGRRGEARPYKPTHEFHPNGWDTFDARPHSGSHPISSGSRVMSHGKMDPSGHLIHIQDEEGNHQTVDKRSLKPLGYGGRSNQEATTGHPLDVNSEEDSIRRNYPISGAENGDDWDSVVRRETRPFNGSLHTSALDVENGLAAGAYTIDAFGALTYLGGTAPEEVEEGGTGWGNSNGEDQAGEYDEPETSAHKAGLDKDAFLGDEVPWGRDSDSMSQNEGAPDMTYHCAHEGHIPAEHEPYAHEARFNAPMGKTCKYCGQDMSGQPARMVHGSAFSQRHHGSTEVTAAASYPCRQCGSAQCSDCSNPDGECSCTAGCTCKCCLKSLSHGPKQSLFKRVKAAFKRTADDNPFSADSDANPFAGGTDTPTGEAALPKPQVTPMTSHPRQKPADNPNALSPPQPITVMPVMPGAPGQGNAGNAASQGFAESPKPSQATAAMGKVIQVAAGILTSNPSMDEDEAVRLAMKAVNTFPRMVTAVGGADYEGDGMMYTKEMSDEEEVLSKCPQCAHEAFNAEIGVCHNCGYRTTHPVYRPGYDPLSGPSTMTPAKAPITGNPGQR